MHPLVWGGGGVDLRGGHFSAKMYAKMKELGPIGDPPIDLPMEREESHGNFRWL